MNNNKEHTVKTSLTEAQLVAFEEVLEAKGMTQAGYIRHLIIIDICKSQDLVCQMNQINDRSKTGPISVEK